VDRDKAISERDAAILERESLSLQNEKIEKEKKETEEKLKKWSSEEFFCFLGARISEQCKKNEKNQEICEKLFYNFKNF
jgi:hypothetical protein